MPDKDEKPPKGEVSVTAIPESHKPAVAALGAEPKWYLSNLKYASGSLSFDYVTPVSNPYSAGAWWVLWPFSMRDYAYYNTDKQYWNWLPENKKSGTITYNVSLNSGQLYTVALFKDNSYHLSDYIEFQV